MRRRPRNRYEDRFAVIDTLHISKTTLKYLIGFRYLDEILRIKERALQSSSQIEYNERWRRVWMYELPLDFLYEQR